MTKSQYKLKDVRLSTPKSGRNQFVDISTQNLPEDAIKIARITFWALKEWLRTHDFGKEDVLLQRYRAGGWENLPMEFVNENASHFKSSCDSFMIYSG